MNGEQARHFESAVLHRQLRQNYHIVQRAQGLHWYLESGQKILDACGGAAVVCLGHGNDKVRLAAELQAREVGYYATTFFTTRAYEDLCRFLVDSTGGHMRRAYIVNSGSEAMEAALKLARQYFLEKENPEPDRINFIGRRQSYHGISLGALSVGGHRYRRVHFEPLLLGNMSQVSPCFAHRGKTPDETDAQYVRRLAEELDAEFQRLGPSSVCAFVAEPVVGAALGCVPPVDGYFRAIQDVCQKYGALLILDEVMCGMGRTGTLHAWEQEKVVPDIQTIGKGLGGGYPVAGILVGKRVVDALEQGTGVFVHGHTYQGHATNCAAALAVQKTIRDEKLLENIVQMGELISRLFKERLGNHPHVGDIRGRGLFWGIEFVADKARDLPFPPKDQVAMSIMQLGLSEEHSVAVYPGSGSAKDGLGGDHIIVSPAYNVTAEDVERIVDAVVGLIEAFFETKKAMNGGPR